MTGFKCSLEVVAGILPGKPMNEFTRRWNFTQADLDSPPKYIDNSGAAINYAMSLMNPQRVNWVRLDWIWY